MNDSALNKRLFSYLSLCAKARKIISGEQSCEIAFRKGDVKLMLVCNDASDNTKKKFSQKAHYYRCPYYCIGEKDVFSSCIGKQNRASFAVTDSGFAEKIEELIKCIQ